MMKRRLHIFVCCTILVAIHGTTASAESSGIVKVDSAELRWLRAGVGTPTLIVIGSSVFYPEFFSKDLQSNLDILFVDSRAAVPSYEPPPSELEQVSLRTFADDLEAVRLSLGIEKVALLGHSVHAQIAIAYADKYANRVSHLVLVGGVPYAMKEFSLAATTFWENDASTERKALLARNRELLKSELANTPPNRRAAVNYHIDGPRYWANPNFDARSLLKGMETSAAFNRLFASLPSREEVKSRLARLKVPVLVALGRYDYIVPFDVWQELIDAIPTPTVRMFSASGHNPQTEEPVLFNQTLTSWLRSSR